MLITGVIYIVSIGVLYARTVIRRRNKLFIKPTDAIDTPALIIDMDALQRNIQTMSAFLRNRKIKLRPHFKTVKIPDIARLQIDAGAKGITCSKLSEAEVLVSAGIADVLLANQVADPAKIRRLAALAKRVRHLTVAVDSADNVHDLSAACALAGSTLNVLVELDIGMGRCGVRDYNEGLAVARAVMEAPNLSFKGIQAYEGHLVLLPDMEARRSGASKALSYVKGFKEYLEKNHIPVSEISGGGTGTYSLICAGDVYTELQAGSYIYMDARYGKLGLPFENALYILGMVMAKRPGLAIIDAGLKCLTTDGGDPVIPGFEQSSFHLSEEHCTLDDPDDRLGICDTVAFIPGHCCTNINVFDIAYGVRNGKVEKVFEVKGRGKSQ